LTFDLAQLPDSARALTLRAMPSPFRRLVLAALVVILPLQALASVAPEQAAPAAMTLDGGHCLNHDHGEGLPGGASSHLCCQHFCPAFAAPGEHLPALPRTAAVGRIALFADLFIPDLPQRPPRA
jgi:hypothetical protein